MSKTPQQSTLGMIALTATALAASVLASGCSSARHDAAAPVSATALSPSLATSAGPDPNPVDTSSAAATPAGDASTGTLTFVYTSQQGWHYSGTVPWPRHTIAFAKDISSSPPGQAQLVYTVDGTSATEADFADDNPGRPNGPQLRVPAGSIEIDTARIQRFLEGQDQLDTTVARGGSCSFGGNDYGYEPYASNFECDLSNLQPSGVVGQGSEQMVDAIVAALGSQSATFVGYMGVQGEGSPAGICDFFVYPSGKFQLSQAYKESMAVCGTLSLSAAS